MNKTYDEINQKSYQNVENLVNFKAEEELKKYRDKKIESCNSTTQFIKKLFKEKINVVEIGSGNSKFLYSLHNQEMLKKGYGIEISKTRSEFAEKWKRDLQITNIENINKDFLTMDISCFNDIDLFICVDIAFQFFDPVYEDIGSSILRKIHDSLNPGGYIILELMSMNHIEKMLAQNNGAYMTWEQFNDTDPFKYSLHQYKQDDKKNIILNKIFIPKDNSKGLLSTMTNVLAPYSPEKIQNLLLSAGFAEIKLFADFESQPYNPNKDEYVVIAQKRENNATTPVYVNNYLDADKKLNILGLIPARSGSKGIPNKNIIDLDGFQLIAYSIAASKMSKLITRTIVSTDGDKIADIAKLYGAEVPFLRPPEFATDSSQDIEFIQHTLDWLKESEDYTPDYIVLLRPTTPLRDVEEIDRAIRVMLENKNATSLRSAHIIKKDSPYKMFKIKDSYYDFFGKDEFNIDDEYHNWPRQQLPATYFPNGYVDIIIPTIVSKQKNKLWGARIKPFITEEIPDIDHLADIDFAKNLIKSNRFNELLMALERMKRK